MLIITFLYCTLPKYANANYDTSALRSTCVALLANTPCLQSRSAGA